MNAPICLYIMYKAAESPSLRMPENLSIKTSFFVISLSTAGEVAGQPSERPYSLILISIYPSI